MRKSIIKKTAAVLLALAMILGFAGCETFNAFKAAFIDPPVEEPERSFKIGILEPMSGADAEAAKEELNGIAIANKYFPEFASTTVELVYADNQSDVSVCPIAAQSLADQGCQFIIGSYKSVLTLASSDVIKNARIPAIAASNTNPLVTSTNPYYFRVSFIDSFEGTCASDFVLNGLKTIKAAVLTFEGNDYGSAMGNAFSAEYKEDIKDLFNKEPETEEEAAEKLEMFGEEFDLSEYSLPSLLLPADTEDYLPYLKALKNQGIDTIYFPSSASKAKEVINQAVLEDYKFNWVGTSTWNGIDVEGVYYTMDFDPKKELSDMAISFRAAYEKEYGTAPSDAAALGFDAYMLIREVVGKLGPDASSRQYVEALSRVENLTVATGYITMSSGGDPIKDILVEQYKDGDFSAVYTIKGLETTRLAEEENKAI